MNDILSFINIVGTIRDISVLRTVAFSDQIKDQILGETLERINFLLNKAIKDLETKREGCLGFFTDSSKLSSIENPKEGDWAIVPSNNVWKIWSYSNGLWTETELVYELPTLNLNEYLTDELNEQKYLQLTDFNTYKNEITPILLKILEISDENLTQLISDLLEEYDIELLVLDAVNGKLENIPTTDDVKRIVRNTLEEDGITPISVDSALDYTSTNPVQNKVLAKIINDLKDLKDSKSKGLYSSLEELIEKNPESEDGDWGIIQTLEGLCVAKYSESDGWTLTQTKFLIELTGYVKEENLKTINGLSILRNPNNQDDPSNIEIVGGGNGGTAELTLEQILNIITEVSNNIKNSLKELIISELEGTLEKHGYKIVESLPEENINEGLIYLILDPNNENKYIQYIHDDTGWHFIGDTTLNLQGYLEKLVSGVNIITINNDSILQGKNIDLSGFITREELYNQLNPLKVSISVSPTLREYTSEPYSINITVQAKKGSNNVSPCLYSVTRTVNGSTTSIGSGNSTTYTDSISDAGTYRYSVTANYSETSENASSSATIYIIYPTYLGFSQEENISNINLSEFNKELKTSLSMTKTLDNTVSGSYLYIITPLSNPVVATDQGFTYKVNMELVGTLNNLKYYRSTSLIDICNLTYYIK